MSRRLELRDRFMAALNFDRDPRIPESTKRRWVLGEQATLPAVAVFLMDEQTNYPGTLGGSRSPVVTRNVRIGVQGVIQTDEPGEADDLMEPLLAYITERIGAVDLRGLATAMTETMTKWEAAQADHFYLVATVIWTVQVPTKPGSLNAAH